MRQNIAEVLLNLISNVAELHADEFLPFTHSRYQELESDVNEYHKECCNRTVKITLGRFMMKSCTLIRLRVEAFAPDGTKTANGEMTNPYQHSDGKTAAEWEEIALKEAYPTIISLIRDFV